MLNKSKLLLFRPVSNYITQEGSTMKIICRLFAVGVLVFFFGACSSGTRVNIQKNNLSSQDRREGKYDVYFQYTSLFYYDVQDQLYTNLMELMHRANALAEVGAEADYVLVVRLKEYNNVSEYDRALYGIYGGEDIMESEVAVVRFDSLKTAKFRKLSGQAVDYGVLDRDSPKETISRGAETIFKMHDDHLVNVDLRTEQRMPTAMAPIELIRMHSEKIVGFILLGKK